MDVVIECGISKSFVQGDECENVFATTYLCSSYITEEMLSCGALKRSSNSYIELIVEPCVSKNQKGIFTMSVWLERKSWKRADAMEKGIPNLKAEFMCMCLREKKITVLKFM